MKVIFRGLGPTDNVVFKDESGKEKLIENGAIVELEDDIAKSYIKLGIAYEVTDEKKANKMQKQLLEAREKREEIAQKSIEQGGKK